jgi:large subunit ribosomal protein L15
LTRKRDQKKTKKFRASRTYGYGTVGQHRKHGQKGGVGKTGGKKHKWTRIVKYDPKYFGKTGFKRPPKYQVEDEIINIGDLNDCIPNLLEEEIAIKDGNYISIDLDKLHYDKVLGKGNLDYKVKITAKKFSKGAIKKIEDAGGQALSLNEINK